MQDCSVKKKKAGEALGNQRGELLHPVFLYLIDKVTKYLMAKLATISMSFKTKRIILAMLPTISIYCKS